ncbi:MAG: ABC transporter permease [Candidatus Bathyarchaeia archaeon]|jgi:peptide/nickel transport system permease protein
MTSLVAYVVRRLLLLVFVLFGVSLVVFAIIMLFPLEQRALFYIHGETHAFNLIQSAIAKYGLSDPVYIQYIHWLFQVFQGNLGWSVSANEPVAQVIATKWPFTFELVLFAAPLIIFIGIYLGVQAAIHKNGPIDQASRLLSIVAWSLPSFFVGMLLLAAFSGILHWFPYSGSLTHAWFVFTMMPKNHYVHYTGVDLFDGVLNGQPYLTLDALWHCVLPVVTVVIIGVALLTRAMRSSMLETMSKPYIMMARAKGLSEQVVIYKHARRNALIPVANLSGMLVAGLLTGLIIAETVFGFGGLGEQVARATENLDIPFIIGFTILSAFILVLTNLIADIVAACVDPRIRGG